MKNSLAQSGSKIVVAVQFDDMSADLLKAAAAIANRTNGVVHAIHVCEPANPVAWSYATGGGFGLENVALMIEEQQIQTAKTRLNELLSQCLSAQPYTSKVMIGNPAQIIAAEATAERASLVVAGASPGSHRFIPKGLSTALSLMGQASRPVLVLTKESKLNFQNDPFRILIADDLRDNSIPALRLIPSLAAIAPRTEILQMHVNGLTRETLVAGLETAAATSHSAPISMATAEGVFTLMMKNIEARMEERFNSALEKGVPEGVKVERMVSTGTVSEELQRVLDMFPADLVVLGRHQTFHHKPFSVGQVPFYSILSLRRAVVIAPLEAN